MTLDESQGHSHWYQSVGFNDVFEHTQFERNQSVQVEMFTPPSPFLSSNHLSRVLSLSYRPDEIQWVWHTSDQQVSTAHQISFRLMKNIVNSTPNFIQTDEEHCETTSAEVFFFSCTPEALNKLKTIHTSIKSRFQWCLSPFQVWMELVHKCPDACQCQTVLMKSAATSLDHRYFTLK